MEDQFTEQFEDDLFGGMPDNSFGGETPQDGNYSSEQDDDFFNEDPQPSDDYITKLLSSKGIDRNAVQFLNEKGEIEQYNWDDLSDQEKLDILSQEDESPITDEELQTLNYLRQNKINLAQFAEYNRRQAIEDYLSQNTDINYTVDQLSDDELFVFDLKERYPNLTDEELADELDAAKANESLFTKKVNTLRDEYKTLQEQEMQQQKEMETAQNEEAYNQMAQSLVEAARNTEDLHGLILEDEDKEDILSFLLDRDVNGQSEFYKLFSNPEALFKMAWYYLKGEEAFNAVNNYYKGVIEQTRRQPSNSQNVRVVKKQKSKEYDPYDLDDVFK